MFADFLLPVFAFDVFLLGTATVDTSLLLYILVFLIYALQQFIIAMQPYIVKQIIDYLIIICRQ